MDRRTFLTGTGTAIAAGLAGCASSDGGAGGTTTTTDQSTTATTQESTTDDETTTDDGSYTVSMVPVGDVTFESVPETWVANNGSWADMGVALGLEPAKGVWLTDRYHTDYYDSIPGVSVDKSGMTSLWSDGLSKEVFYELDADVHVMDPNFVVNRFKNWSMSDVEEIQNNVAPFFGNSIFAHHYPWHSDYRYYTLYEAFEKLAQVFQRTDRYQAFTAVHDDFKSNLAPVVPKASERPSVGVFWGVGEEPTEFYPYVIGGGTGFKHLRELGVHDALAESDIKDFHGSRAAIDMETMLEVDPEVIMLRGYETMSREQFQDTIVTHLESHNTAKSLTAVKNGDVYRAGGLYQGPITYMVLTERTATQLYGFEGELFDRQRVSEIVNGNR